VQDCTDAYDMKNVLVLILFSTKAYRDYAYWATLH